MPAYNCSLFLSVDPNDVKEAIKNGFPAGYFLKTQIEDNEESGELRVAFDFDGVLADDASEIIYQKEG